MADSLGDRMKNYEKVSSYRLVPRSPVIIRLDGKAFHTFTKKCNKPFDQDLIDSMALSAQAVANEIQGFKLAYVQSDEASFVLTDYDEINTQGWFDYKLSKIVSIAASIMTANFNKIYGSSEKLAYFDARAFNIPESEIANCILWRIKDWNRNSIQMYSRAFYSHKELNKKNVSDMHEMLYKKGKNWSKDLSAQIKNGTFILKGIPNLIFIDQEINYDIISNIVKDVLK